LWINTHPKAASPTMTASAIAHTLTRMSPMVALVLGNLAIALPAFAGRVGHSLPSCREVPVPA
jgi:hypothetical protein